MGLFIMNLYQPDTQGTKLTIWMCRKGRVKTLDGLNFSPTIHGSRITTELDYSAAKRRGALTWGGRAAGG